MSLEKIDKVDLVTHYIGKMEALLSPLNPAAA
jgi:hypothetical protein